MGQETVSPNIGQTPEELLAMQGELATSNEEPPIPNQKFEAKHEELQATNEELERRNTELSQTVADLGDLLLGADIPVIILDGEFRIVRFTAAAGKALHLIPAHAGQPIQGLATPFDVVQWRDLLAAAVRQLCPFETEVRDHSGHWYTMRIRPYRYPNHRIGVLVALLDIDAVRRKLDESRKAHQRAEQSARQTEAVLRQTQLTPARGAAGVGMWDWDIKSGRIRCTEEWFHLHRQPTRTSTLSIEDWLASVHPQDRDRIRRELTKALEGDKPYNAEFRVARPDGTIGWVMATIQVLPDPAGNPGRMLGTSVDITARRSLEDALRESEAQLRALAASLVAGHEDERKRIARELHDDFNQRMALVANELTMLEESVEQLGPQLASIRRKVAEMSDDLRRVAYRLHPTALEHFGLGAALDSLCSEVSKTYQIRIRFAPRHADAALRGEVALCLYRISQECLNNIVRHSGATEARIELMRRKHRVYFSVSDNGKGYEIDPNATGLGMLNIRERARALGGTVSIRPGPGRGTRVEVHLPLPQVKL